MTRTIKQVSFAAIACCAALIVVDSTGAAAAPSSKMQRGRPGVYRLGTQIDVLRTYAQSRGMRTSLPSSAQSLSLKVRVPGQSPFWIETTNRSSIYRLYDAHRKGQPVNLRVMGPRKGKGYISGARSFRVELPDVSKSLRRGK